MKKKLLYFIRKTQYFYHYSRGSSYLPYPPFTISIDLTNHCNLKCIMCPHGYQVEWKKGLGFIKMELLEKIINEVKHYSFEVILNIAGEPLLHPNIVEAVKLVKSAGLKASFGTNATLLTAQKAKDLILSGLDEIEISFEGEDKENYEKIRRGAKYEKVLENIINFLKIKKELNSPTPRVIIQVIKFYPKDTSLTISNHFKQIFKGLPVDQFTSVWAHKWAADFESQVQCLYEEPSQQVYSPCRLLWMNIAIGWDGTVYPCCFDLTGTSPIGNVKENSLLSLWNSKKLMNLRKQLANKNYQSIALCKNCLCLWETQNSFYKVAKFNLRKIIKYFSQPFFRNTY